jgi:hypothetical protein
MFSGKSPGPPKFIRLSRVGIEAYTIRDLLKQDFNGTLAKIAAIGYKEVEFGPTIQNPKEARATLDRLTHRKYKNRFRSPEEISGVAMDTVWEHAVSEKARNK